jgi:hypothetical protein
MRGQGSVPTRAANTFNHDVIQPINRDVIRPVAHFAADFGRSVWHFASEFAQGVGDVFTGLIRGIRCIGSFGSPAAGVCSSAANDQVTQGSGQVLRGSAGLCLDLCPVKGGKYLAKIPFIRRTIDRFGHWIKPGETVAQRTARYASEDTAKALEAAGRVSPWAGTSLSRVTKTEETMYRVWGWWLGAGGRVADAGRTHLRGGSMPGPCTAC